ncbi:MAG: YchF/TatD family DNA exonuclease [Candidatus Paraimprobicoccus trichonymphae]|uniref:YchF/TatD family DNA exonuclease n=1 Tax=Candidatus Paraimprobicoccus trichonymphae TaxID=3033793 RepID=A0AA48IA17_9FIRM|nr:MAG: YchF/TatD family DNA exonuclease [Candidatus Paraimprobicoccus trichonymphae]
MNSIFDTHAHYHEKLFDKDRDFLLKDLAKNQGIFAILELGTNLKSSKKSLELSEKYDFIYSAVGVHPLDLENLQENYLQEIENLIFKNKKIVAIGEIGLDYHYGNKNKNFQKEVLINQINLAKKYNLPVCIHDRESHNDVLEILEKYKPKGIVHCFSGNLKFAKKIVNLGLYLGIGGMITYEKTNKNLVEIVKNISVEKILLETDCPYLTPYPEKAKRCDSSYIKLTAKKISDILNLNIEETYNITKQNAIGLFFKS